MPRDGRCTERFVPVGGNRWELCDRPLPCPLGHALLCTPKDCYCDYLAPGEHCRKFPRPDTATGVVGTSSQVPRDRTSEARLGMPTERGENTGDSAGAADNVSSQVEVYPDAVTQAFISGRKLGRDEACADLLGMDPSIEYSAELERLRREPRPADPQIVAIDMMTVHAENRCDCQNHEECNEAMARLVRDVRDLRRERASDMPVTDTPAECPRCGIRMIRDQDVKPWSDFIERRASMLHGAELTALRAVAAAAHDFLLMLDVSDNVDTDEDPQCMGAELHLRRALGALPYDLDAPCASPAMKEDDDEKHGSRGVRRGAGSAEPSADLGGAGGVGAADLGGRGSARVRDGVPVGQRQSDVTEPSSSDVERAARWLRDYDSAETAENLAALLAEVRAEERERCALEVEEMDPIITGCGGTGGVELHVIRRPNHIAQTYASRLRARSAKATPVGVKP